jgi:hypothetical protein
MSRADRAGFNYETETIYVVQQRMTGSFLWQPLTEYVRLSQYACEQEIVGLKKFGCGFEYRARKYIAEDNG